MKHYMKLNLSVIFFFNCSDGEDLQPRMEGQARTEHQGR